MRYLSNPLEPRPKLQPIYARLFGPEGAKAARDLLPLRPQATGPTPLHALPELARALGLGSLHVKDEGQRLGLGSFKALGGAHAVMSLILAEGSKSAGHPLPPEALTTPALREIAARHTFICATDGNHGRSVAQGARLLGAKSVILVHSGVSAARAEAIAAQGAEVRRTPGTYDDSVAEAARLAEVEGWTLVSDTAWPGYEEIPALVMQGYTALAAELLEALPAPPTHIFLQAGVGGFAAAVGAYLQVMLGEAAPKLIVVEPERAPCLYESALRGQPVKVPHDEATVMGMLECYEPSLIAHEILGALAEGYLLVPESAAVTAMQRLGRPEGDDPAITAGESGGAGLAGLLTALGDRKLAQKLGLDASARVALIVTEGATDPAAYRRLTGLDPLGASAEHPGGPMPKTELALQMRAYRHHLHRHPEFGFEEVQTAAFVAQELRRMGLHVTEGIGGTGVVGTLRRGQSKRAIALRADMDALRIPEATGLPYASANPGVMHACGHDGHTAMLLGAAQVLAREGGFDGTIQFLFQPAEEWGLGAQAMLDDGVLDRCPFDEIYGLHNMPGLPIGHFESRPGAIMSAEDIFEITLSGQGGHASRPDWGREVALPAAELVVALQAIVARRLDPTVTAVVSVTEISTDGARNILPGHARIAGDCRSFAPEVSQKIEAEMRRITAGIAEAHGIQATLSYRREFIPTLNDPTLHKAIAQAAAPVSAAVHLRPQPMTGSEDFARFLTHVPGVFSFIGNGEGSAPLHNPAYDFNDEALLHGAQVHIATARARLPMTEDLP